MLYFYIKKEINKNYLINMYYYYYYLKYIYNIINNYFYNIYIFYYFINIFLIIKFLFNLL